MLIHPWFFMAVTAAVIWGLSYAVSEHVLKSAVSAPSLLFIYAIFSAPLYALFAYIDGSFFSSLEKLSASRSLMLWMAVIVIGYFAANLLVFSAISAKNATVASLIEISYPLFTALFAWILYRDIQLNWAVFAGAVMIIVGTVVVYRYS